jgi:hypothetical protein
MRPAARSAAMSSPWRAVLSADQERSRYEVHVPAAGQIWWRSAVRARLEAAQAATRPMTWLHGIAGACAIGLTWALAGVVWPSVRELAAWLAAQTFGVDSGLGGRGCTRDRGVAESLPLAFVVRGLHRPGAGPRCTLPCRTTAAIDDDRAFWPLFVASVDGPAGQVHRAQPSSSFRAAR